MTDVATRSTSARLARLHLRTGAVALARAELETLAGEDALDDEALADLAEVRWRTGDLAGAGEAARAYLETGNESAVALAIAAEAAVALGRPGEARRLAQRAVAHSPEPIDDVFAGMPRSAVWPGSPTDHGEQGPLFAPHLGISPSVAPPPTHLSDAASSPTGRGHAPAPDRPTPGAPTRESAFAAGLTVAPPFTPTPVTGSTGTAETADGPVEGPVIAPAPEPTFVPRPRGLWDDVPTAAPALPAPRDALDAGRAALAAGDLDAAVVQFAIAIRLEPGLAAAVLGLVASASGPGIELLRGDALRLAGHEEQARRAWAAAFASHASAVDSQASAADPRASAIDPQASAIDPTSDPKETP